MMRRRSLRLWSMLPLLVASPSLADTLATGDPATLLNIDDGFVSGLDGPTAIAFTPDGRLVIAQRTGAVRVRPAAGGALVNAGSFPVFTSQGEQGLLGLAVHPQFATNRTLFFYYSAASGPAENRHRVVTVQLSDQNMISGEQTIVQNLFGPANHNGGGLSIYNNTLFIGVGDTGCNSREAPGTVGNYFGTCLTNANGKVLRVNFDGTPAAGNPLAAGASVSACGSGALSCTAQRVAVPGSMSTMPRREIFAWGFRNPFRLWADPKTGNVWVGDVGEITFEEINVIPAAGGKHFGYPWREGRAGQDVSKCGSITPNVGNCVEPVYVCEANGSPVNDPNVPNGCSSITGGVILDACEWPSAFEGRYVFGDFPSRAVWTLQVNGTRTGIMGDRANLATLTGGGPTQFLEHAGALYVVAHAGGQNGHITRISPKTPEASCGGGGGGAGGAGGGGAGGASGGSAGSGGNAGAAGASGGAGSPAGGAAGSGGASAGSAGAAQGGSTAGTSPTAGTTSGGSAPTAGSGGGAPIGGAAGAAAGAAGSTSGAAGGGGGEDDGGCGCRVVGSRGGALAGLLAAAAGIAALRRRRRGRKAG